MTNIRNLPTPTPNNEVADHWAHKLRDGGYSDAIAAQWVKIHGRDDAKPHAVPGTLFRASNAGNCLKQLAYYMQGADESDPPTPADRYRMDVGSILHEFVQTTDIFGEDAQFEVPFEIESISLSGSADVVVGDTLVEVKSAGGFPFKRIGIFNNATGPKENHLRQAALGAHALGLDHIVLLYIGLEVVNAGDVSKYDINDNQRWIAEYHYTMADLQHFVDEEIRRHNVVRILVEQGGDVPRHLPDMPDGATINRPKPKSGKATWTLLNEGNVVDTGTHWACNYCRYQTRCQTELDAQRAENKEEA